MSGVEAILRRDRWVVGAGLGLISALAWIYVWRGAGMGMSATDMTAAVLFPHMHPDDGVMDAAFPATVAMWWTMMIAMMTPSAAPMILLHSRVLRFHASGNPPANGLYAPGAALVGGYLAVWLLFSVFAALLQNALQPAGLVSEMMLWSKSAILSASVLAAAGLYQLSPVKRACLTQCRAPAQFLTRYWRPGRWGAVLLGARHGGYCVGCCWLLMMVLFVGGVMNLVWIAMLTLLVSLEKLAPMGEMLGKVSGYLLLAWAVATLVV